MAAHYAGAIPLDLLQAEQTRITAELADAQHQLDQATQQTRKMEPHVEVALALPTDASAQYQALDNTGKQLMNQAIWIGDDHIEATHIKPGLAELISTDLEQQLQLDRAEIAKPQPQTNPQTNTKPGQRGAKTAAPTSQADTTGKTQPHPPFITQLLQTHRSEPIPGRQKNLRHTRNAEGSNMTVLVGPEGLEPPTSTV